MTLVLLVLLALTIMTGVAMEVVGARRATSSDPSPLSAADLGLWPLSPEARQQYVAEEWYGQPDDCSLAEAAEAWLRQAAGTDQAQMMPELSDE